MTIRLRDHPLRTLSPERFAERTKEAKVANPSHSQLAWIDAPPCDRGAWKLRKKALARRGRRVRIICERQRQDGRLDRSVKARVD